MTTIVGRVGRRTVRGIALAGVVSLMYTAAALAQQQPGMPGSVSEPSGVPASVVPAQLDGVGFQQRLNELLPLDARFRDERGRDVRLGDYFGRRPVVLAFVYYQCPMLCTQIMSAVSGALKAVPYKPGQDFDVVYVSIDPRDVPEAAAAKKAAVLADYDQTDTAAGWHFLTGDEANIALAAKAAGFSYRWDERIQQFAHVSGLLVLTPDGRLSRYFYGIEYSPKELRMALVESSEGRIGSPVDELLLYCYHYDPETGKYGAVVMNIMRLGGALTVLLLGGFIWLAMRKDVGRAPAPTPAPTPLTHR